MRIRKRVIAVITGASLATACILIAASNGLAGQAMTENGTATMAIWLPLVSRAAKIVYIPAGEFQMGCDDSNPSETCESPEQPLHTVYLEAYYIDKYEVTNVQHNSCVDAGICGSPSHSFSYTRGSYCGNLTYDNYPDRPDLSIDCCVGDTDQVGSYPGGANPYGVMDISGNVWEWVNDWYAENYYDSSPYSNPPGPSNGSETLPAKVLRGHAWYSEAPGVRSAFRARNHAGFVYNGIGIRCAKDAD